MGFWVLSNIHNTYFFCEKWGWGLQHCSSSKLHKRVSSFFLPFFSFLTGGGGGGDTVIGEISEKSAVLLLFFHEKCEGGASDALPLDTLYCTTLLFSFPYWQHSSSVAVIVAAFSQSSKKLLRIATVDVVLGSWAGWRCFRSFFLTDGSLSFVACFKGQRTTFYIELNIDTLFKMRSCIKNSAKK